jgi:porin
MEEREMRKRLNLQAATGFMALVLVLSLHASVWGYDLTDKFSIGGIIAGAYQHQWLDDDKDGEADDNIGRGAVNFEPEFSFRPNDNNEFFAKFGFGAGNGLNGVTDFRLAPWAANLEDDYKDINGRNRDYLLTAWYKYMFNFGEDNALGLTGGIIDATDYIDENAYANDVFTQFMNEALVNGPKGFFPSFDIGGAVEWEVGNFDITAMGMNIGENDDGNNYHFYAGQLA